MWQWLDDLLQLVVQHQHKGAAHASEHVGPRSLEEGLATFVACNLAPAVNSSGVHDLGCGRKKSALGCKWTKKRTLTVVNLTSFTAGLHHHTPTDSVEGVRGQAGNGRDRLCNHPAHQDVGVLGVREHTCRDNPQQRLKTLLPASHSCCFTVKNAPLAVS